MNDTVNIEKSSLEKPDDLDLLELAYFLSQLDLSDRKLLLDFAKQLLRVASH